MVTLFLATGYSAFQTVISINAKGNIKKYKVNFDPNGGYIDINSKYVGTKYGTLPTPTREGYTFKGWNSKNMLNPNDVFGVKYDGQISNEAYTYDAQTESFVANFDDRKHIYGYDVTNYIDIGKTYTFSINILQNGTSNIASIGFDTMKDGERRVFYNHINTIVDNRIFYTLTIPEGVTRCIVGVNNGGTEQTGLIFNNVQLEEGDSMTDYEPYFITSETKVVQKYDHTLTAIWEENS